MGNQPLVPQICGNEQEIEEATRSTAPVTLQESNLKITDLESTFALALHMHQPLIPDEKGKNISESALISNLEFMLKGDDEYNASVFLDCYGRMGSIMPELVEGGGNPRIMLDYSGELFYGLRKMGHEDVIEKLRPLACDPKLRRTTEWLGTMWGHAVAPSTPPPDFKLHIRAWQHEFAACFGIEALRRVRGFSPPEMHLPNHPDVAYEYIKTLKECGYQWLLVQEHTVETLEGHGICDKHLPHRLIAKNSRGEEVTLLALVKTQGSDTKLVAQIQPMSEAATLKRRDLAGKQIPQIVTQIGDGENGGVMMNEFPPGYRQAFAKMGTKGNVGINGTEYLEMLFAAGAHEADLPALRPLHQEPVFSRIKKWEEGAADRAIAEIKKENASFNMEGGSWTNNISWVSGYENVLSPMNKLSAEFHAKVDRKKIDTRNPHYQQALFHLLAAETSCFRYWGQGRWTDYAREICRRGTSALANI